jgi:hypothetical protein
MIILCEGSSDFLAADTLIDVEEMETMVSPVTVLGASNRLHLEALCHFPNKHIFGFPDCDPAGINGMSDWCKQLDGVARSIEVFDYIHLSREDGEPINHLRDLLRVAYDQWEEKYTV